MAQVNDAPWSAAFIVWVVNEAAKKTTGLTFPTGPNFVAHVEYANAIRRGGFPWQALNPWPGSGVTARLPLELRDGDIIVENRANNTQTFEGWDRITGWRGFSHGDIVVEDLMNLFQLGPGARVIGGNVSDSIKAVNKRDLRNYFVVLRPNRRAHGVIIRDVAKAELKLWQDNNWTSETQAGARDRVALYWASCGVPYIPSLEFTSTGVPTQATAAISSNIESLESFHPNIQYELTRRRVSAETANTYMPFVKLTSLSKVLPENLPDGQTSAYCPSLGIHDQDNITFDDIYLPKDNKSTIGYARAGANGEIPVPVVVDSTRDAANIPIPGITQFTVERSTAGPMGVRGGLVKVDLKIVAYSIGQVDALLRYYLRPGTRLVLELGRMSANQKEKVFLKEKPIEPYKWKQSESDISTYFSELIKSPILQASFIKEYIYNNNGNYEAFITYVVKFNLKYNKNNTFEIDLTLHSVQQVEIPTTHTAVQSTCPSPTKACDTMDIQEYFDDKYSWKNNSFSKLVSHYETKAQTADEIYWSTQLVSIKKTNPTPSAAGAPSTSADTRENEYFVSWNFFVGKILNDNQYGIASMLGNAEVAKLALLQVTEVPTGSKNEGLIANQCGYHPNLRSTSADVMLIVNKTANTRFKETTDSPRFNKAIELASRDNDLKIGATVSASLQMNDIETRLIAASDSFDAVKDTGFGSQKAGASFLSKGVWLNTKAIKQAFTSADTISSAISSLLGMMNSATQGYWNLQLYSTDVKNPGMHIIDMGLSKEPKLLSKPSRGIDKEEEETNNILNSITGITPARYRVGDNEDEPKYIYMFNRGTKLFNDGELGSELIDLNVEFNLPQVIAVQAIANIGGPAQKPLLSSINVEELQDISLIKGLYTSCDDSTDNSICESDIIQGLNTSKSIAERDVARARQAAEQAMSLFGLGAELRQENSQNDFKISRVTLETIELKLDTIQIQQFNPNLIGTVREYAHLGTALKFIELNPSRMMKELNIDSVSGTIIPRSTTHAFNSSNLTKTVIDITLPGIGGIGLFQSFLVDRIPSIITRGFYVVTKVVHEFSTQNGWITKIQGRFRFKPEKAKDAPVITQSRTPANPATSPMALRPNELVSNFRNTTISTQLNPNTGRLFNVDNDSAVVRTFPVVTP